MCHHMGDSVFHDINYKFLMDSSVSAVELGLGVQEMAMGSF